MARDIKMEKVIYILSTGGGRYDPYCEVYDTYAKCIEKIKSRYADCLSEFEHWDCMNEEVTGTHDQDFEMGIIDNDYIDIYRRTVKFE